ncbi:MAG: hypothetical protein ACYS8K_06455 [Planctomycetota bacterium]|jgi:hypothetical protein
MASKDTEPSDRPQSPIADDETEGRGGSLVPFYGVPGISPGLQAFRRGEMILYTVRGEPAKVVELMGKLDQQGVGEVVALISHRAEERIPPPEQQGEDTQQ